jgi:hypothetical protein
MFYTTRQTGSYTSLVLYLNIISMDTHTLLGNRRWMLKTPRGVEVQTVFWTWNFSLLFRYFNILNQKVIWYRNTAINIRCGDKHPCWILTYELLSPELCRLWVWSGCWADSRGRSAPPLKRPPSIEAGTGDSCLCQPIGTPAGLTRLAGSAFAPAPGRLPGPGWAGGRTRWGCRLNRAWHGRRSDRASQAVEPGGAGGRTRLGCRFDRAGQAVGPC